MKKLSSLVLIPLAIMALSACDSGSSSSSGSLDYEVNLLSPSGAPTLAIYDKMGSGGKTQTTSVPTNVAAAFKTADYDALIFDAVSGLAVTKSNTLDWKLATLLTGGNLYLVGIGADKTAQSVPTADSYIVSFGKNLLPDLAFQSLESEYWKWSAPVDNYVAGVSDTLSILKTGVDSSGTAVDYVVTAQPILKVAQSAGTTDLTVVKNLRSEWKAYSGQNAIPQAGLFVRKATYDAHKPAFDAYLSDVETNCATAIDDPSTIADYITANYPDSTSQSAAFGFPVAMVNAIQGNSANGFAMLKRSDFSSVSGLINDFLTKLGQTTYDSSYFLS